MKRKWNEKRNLKEMWKEKWILDLTIGVENCGELHWVECWRGREKWVAASPIVGDGLSSSTRSNFDVCKDTTPIQT